ncbi:MAG: hypothetical protein ACD_79C01379G0004 [uncultured bacterium]|nr:MAG: hypothetical protein ACD_79C01379G0004 [uncultured bacterium]
MSFYKILDWDTDFFGFKVAQITTSRQSPDELQINLNTLKSLGVKLVYFFSENILDKEYKFLLSDFNGNLVDRKVTFFIDLIKINSKNIPKSKEVNSYNKNMSMEDLENLAVESGRYSRFAIDPKISENKYLELYKIWIRKSVKKEIANELFVINKENKIYGMITLIVEKNEGKIGLLSVDSNSRNIGDGRKLINAVHLWLLNNECKSCYVVTQMDNVVACNFYKNCGYSVHKLEYCYHFWL